MKMTIDELKEILSKKPVLTNEMEIKEVFSLLGFKLKEYYKAGLSASQSYEVHYRRNYLIRVHVDDSRCVSISNEFIKFEEGCSGVSFGGIDTVTELIQTVVLMAQRIDRSYKGEAYFDEEESEYTEEEYAALIEVLNEEVFKEAE
jgi:hypothetical protein